MKGKLRALVAMVMTAMMLTSCGANAGSRLPALPR